MNATAHLRHLSHGSERLGCNASRLSRLAAARLHALLRPEYALLETLEGLWLERATPAEVEAGFPPRWYLDEGGTAARRADDVAATPGARTPTGACGRRGLHDSATTTPMLSQLTI